MANRIGKPDKYSRFKPRNMQNFLTRTEVAKRVGRSRERILQLEKERRIPKPVSVKVGELQVRLYSPADVAKIEAHFATAKPGRPRT
jgi:predicted DNA-binding transcriptional regulator AlpA